MISTKRFGLTLSFFLLILTLQIVLIINAQAECEALVTSGFTALADTCTDIDGNSACTTASEGESFSLNDVDTLSTTMNDELMEGALLNVHANIPLALSEQGLRFFLIGDVTVENAVDPASALEPSAGATVTTIVGANIRSIPSADGRLVTTAPVGTELIADGKNGDGQWLHVLTEQGTAWISRQIISVVDGDIDGLPIIGNDTRTIWQNITLTTANDGDGCGEDFPSMLLIQGPQDVLATITVNNVEIRLDSEIVLQIDENNVLNLYTLEGVAIGDGISVPAGFTMSIQLSSDGLDRNGAWTNLRPINDDERGFLLGLQLLPESLLYQPIEVPTEEQVSELLASINQSTAGAGQTVVTSVGRGRITCTGFQPTFPLDALTPGVAPFYWDGAQGAEGYRLNFYDVGGAGLGSFTVDATNPTYQVDPGSIVGDRGQFAWNVDALIGGEVACSTGKAIVQRVAGSAPQTVGDNNNSQPAPKATKCKWNSC